MCFTGLCPYEDLMGDCSIVDREKLATLPDASCNYPEVSDEKDKQFSCGNCFLEGVKKDEE